MFDRVTHSLVGQRRMYMPQGRSPYARDWNEIPDSRMVLFNGDAVEVLSAWTRPYLPTDAPTLFYVRSEFTGQATHVTEADLIAL